MRHPEWERRRTFNGPSRHRCEEEDSVRKIFEWWSGILVTFLRLAVLRIFLPLPFANEILIFSIYTMGCNFLLGRVGFISFGQPAYLAAGAYATAFYLFYF